MVKVVNVKFNSHGKAYYFDPLELEVNTGDKLIVETSKGLDIGECAFGEHYVLEDSIVPPLRPVIRIATQEDLRVAQQNKEREKEAFAICKEKILAHGLDMKLVDVECGFEGNKILFFFTADGRVDFRDLVKDLAAVFRTRIELRQIGVRDETKMLGGLGICGRPYCCSQFLDDFQPVSTKMAKTQSMSLNPTKISGSCGRLMCCLRYEQDAYEDLIKTIPKVGAFVQTPSGYGNVISTNVLRQKVKVRIDESNEQELKVLDANQVATVPGGRPKPGEPLPQVLQPVAKAEEAPEPSSDPWAAPSLFAEDAQGLTQKSGWEEEKAPVQSSQVKIENRRPEQNRQSPAKNGGKHFQQHGAKPPSKQSDAQTPQAQNQQKQVGEQALSQGEKPKNQNRNKKRHYNRPKPKNDGQNKQAQ
ncbi:MAG: hypothetical protein EOM51_03995 [Clostridia bacterium]|nr:hypothetical protein [Clostridia bacterium]